MLPTMQHDTTLARSLSFQCYSLISFKRHFEAGMFMDELPQLDFVSMPDTLGVHDLTPRNPRIEYSVLDLFVHVYI